MSSTPSRRRLILALLILGHLVITLAYSAANPLGEAPDEADHWAYVFYLAREHRLPTGPRVTQSKHPPLYHAGAALVASLGDPANDFLRANPDVAVSPGPTKSLNFFIHTTTERWPWQGGVLAFHLARLWSALLSTLTVAAVYGLGRAVLPAWPGMALLATGLAAALPEFAFIGAAVSNDGLAALCGTLALWGGFAIYRAGGDWRAGWWTGLALGLGLLTKVSTSALWPVIGALVVAGAISGHARPAAWVQAMLRTGRTWVISGLAIFVPALLLASPWLWRNGRLYGDPLGMALAAQTVDGRVPSGRGGWGWPETVWLLRGWFFSFWGKFGGAGHIPFPAPVYWALGGVTVVAAAGLLLAWRKDAAIRVSLALLAAAGLAVAGGIWRYSLLALGTDQGRLLFPALGPAVILLAVGLSAWPWSKARAWLGHALVIALFGLALYGLFGVIRPAFAPPSAPVELDRATRPATPPKVGELVLDGWELADEPILYWRAATSPTQDYRTHLRVVTPDDALVWEWRRSPGYGRFSTDRWPAGTVVADRYRIGWPDWAGPGQYLVEIGVYPYGGDLVLPVGSADAYVLLGEITR